jgi:hypothetical protein
VAAKACVLVLEGLEKRRLLRAEYRAYPPEATASIYNRSFFWWLNALFRKGFNHELDVDHLFALDKQLQASYCYKRLHAAWASGGPFRLISPAVLLLIYAFTSPSCSCPFPYTPSLRHSL